LRRAILVRDPAAAICAHACTCMLRRHVRGHEADLVEEAAAVLEALAHDGEEELGRELVVLRKA
jgi:hypothetical protein